MTSPAPVSWKSAVSGSWNTAADWSGGAVPNAASDVMIAVAGAYTVALNSAAAIHSLTLSDTAATLTIAAPAATVQIAGGLTNSGWVDIDTADYGGTTVKIGGTLTNSGYLTIGDAASAGVTSPTLVSAGGLANTGHITLWGPDATVLDINAAAALGGTIELHGNSTLEFATGAITAIAAGTMLTEDSGAASVALAADVYTPNSALTTLAGNAGTLAFENGANLATTVDFTNAAGALVEIDATGSGGSSLAIGGLLTNKGTIEVGNTGLIADAALAAAAVQNTGLIYFESDTGAANLSVTGDFTNASGGAVYVDTYYRDAGGSYLDIGGTLTNNGGFYIGSGASPTSVTANAVVNGATLELANGAALVVDAGLTNSGYLYVNSYYYNNTGGGGSLYVGGTLTNKGDVYIGYYGSNSAATTVSAAAVANSGFLDLYSGNAAASLSVTGAFGNSGTVEVDYGGNGGSTLKIGGTLTNSGYFYIGYTSLTKPTLVTAASLANTGYIELMGGAAAATLDITGVAPTTLGGNVYVLGDALFEFGSGAVTGIASGAALTVDGAQARVALSTTPASNSALTGLASNAGTFDLADGAALATTVGLTNTGAVYVDSYYYDQNKGGSNFAIGGTLTNKGDVYIGYYGSNSAATTVSAAAVTNSGFLDLYSGSAAASLSVTGAFGNSGTVEVDYGGNGGSTLKIGGTLTNSGYFYIGYTSLTKPTLVSAAAVSNTDYVQIASGTAAVAAKVTGGFGNTGNVSIDTYGVGGSTVTIGQALTNSGTLDIGNTSQTKTTLVSAASLSDTGSIDLFGGASAGAVLDIAGPAPATVNANQTFYIDNALFEFANGGLTGIASSGQLALIGGKARVALASAPASNSALTGLASNAGTLVLASGAALTTNVALTNTGSIFVDSYYYATTGGSNFAVGGTLTNKGDVYIGYYGSNSAATTVSAAAVANSGFLDLYSGNAAASLSVTGAFGNSGTVEVDYGGNGGSTLKIGGTLTNSGYFYIGYTSLTKPTLVTAASLANTGYIELMGGAAAATLDITGVAPTTLGGNVYVLGDALFEFGSGAVTGIASGAALTVDGAQARVALSTTPASNSALTGLASNAGTFDLADGAALATTVGLTNTGAVYVDSYYYDQNKGGSKFAIGGTLTNKGDVYIGYYGSNSAATTVSAAALTNQQFLDLYSGSAAASLSVTGAFGNSGTVEVDYGGNGGSTLKIGGTLTNSGYFYIGYTSLTKPTLVTAAALANTGTIDLVGGSAAAATLDITGVAPAALSGYLYLAGDALFEFGGGAVTGIASGAQVTLNGAKALIALSTATTGNSALTGLASNAGYFYLDGGASLAVTGGFTNNYVFGVDQSGAGGSSFSVAAALANSSGDTIYAGNGGLTAAGKITAASLANNGYLYLQGGAGSATETLSLAGASSDAGYMVVYPGGVLALGGTLTVTGTLYVDGGTVSGGTLAAAGSGLIEGAGTATLSNVTIARGASFIALSGSTLVDNGITVNGALSGSGAATLAFAKTGTDSLANVSGFAAITLANGAANTLNLAAANFAGISTGRITIADGNAGNTVTAANLPAADAILVHAGSGADTLTGGAGNDVFYAGGDTAMTGGGGANQFVFAAPGSNTISDFHFSSANALVFSNAGFNLGLSGATATPQAMSASQAASLFTENSSGAFTSAAQRLAYDTSNGQLFASAGGSSSTPKLVATLSDHAAIAASQLFFIS
jgi:fibronectin-binding autotransporter adhesin